MSILSELRSGKFSIYAQWCALLSIIFLVVFGTLNIISSYIVSAILAFIFAFIILLVEVPLMIKCCPTGPRFDRFIRWFENNYLRSILYLIFAIVMWCSATWLSLTMISAAITLSLAAIFYSLAALTHQERATSTLTGGKGVEVAGAAAYV